MDDGAEDLLCEDITKLLRHKDLDRLRSTDS